MADTQEKQPETKTEEAVTAKEATEQPQEEQKAESKEETATAKPASKPLSDEDLGKVKYQIEFYFSDSNFPKDKFLLDQAKQNKEGFIPLQVLTTFNRLKSITTDLDQIRKAIADSKVVMLSEDGSMIKRQHPVPDKLELDERTLFVRGFDKTKTLDELINFFKQYGTVNAVRVVRDKKTKTNTNTLYLELGSKEEATKFAEEKKVLWDDKEITVVTKQQHLQNQKEKVLGKRNDPEVPSFEPGLLVQVKGLPEGGTFGAVELKTFLKEHADVQYVEFIKGDTEGIARCGTPEEAKKLIACTTPFNDVTLTYSVIEGEPEKMYWTRVARQKAEKKNRGGGGGGKRRRHK